jgi:protein phosphatase
MKTLITSLFYDIGGREIYEDRVAVRHFTTPGGLDLTVAMVADGVGGSNRGERAAQLAIDTTLDYLAYEARARDVPELLHRAFVVANRAVCQEAEETQGATTTLAAAVVHDGRLYIANVGDSRVYFCRNGKLTQLTLDHSFANVMPMLGKLSAAAAAANPRADVLVRFLGNAQHFEPDLGFYVDTADEKIAQSRGQQGLELRTGDSVLVCSDGLIKTTINGQPAATPAEIVQVLDTQEGDKAARSLVSFALGRSVDDNVSVALIQVPDRKRRRRARRPFLWAALVALTVILLSTYLIWANSEQRVEDVVNNAKGTATAQQSEISTQIAATASSGAETATAIAETELQATAAAAESLKIQQAQMTETAWFEETQATAQEATLVAQSTCLQSENYDYRVNNLTLSPPPGYVHVSGSRPPPDLAIQLVWSITNTGKCPLNVIGVYSEKSELAGLQPSWLQAGQPIRVRETADLTMTLPITTMTLPISQGDSLITWRNWFRDNSIAWKLIVASEGVGSNITLSALPSLTLRDGDTNSWIIVVDPPPSPTPVISMTAVITSTPLGPEPVTATSQP